MGNVNPDPSAHELRRRVVDEMMKRPRRYFRARKGEGRSLDVKVRGKIPGRPGRFNK